MVTFLIAGAGRQAKAVSFYLLSRFQDSQILLVDTDEQAMQAVLAVGPDQKRVSCHQLSVSPITPALEKLVASADCLISCVPFFLNEELSRLAIRSGTHFCDLGGNKDTVLRQLQLSDDASKAGVSVVPDCGLAPGCINVFAEYWKAEWTYKRIKLYCGGLPQNPEPPLSYALTFSPWGLFNEYFDDCEVARDGRVQTVAGLAERETVNDLLLEGEFEAFMTSGGASLGPRLYAPLGVDYEYKTLRYPGHCDILSGCRQMGLFSFEERLYRVGEAEFRASPALLNGQVLEASIPSQGDDVIIGRAEVEGEKDGEPVIGRIDLLDYAAGGLTAMERTTGFPTAIVAAAQVGLYAGHKLEPGAFVPAQVIDPRLMLDELKKIGVTGISVKTGKEVEAN